MFPSLPKKIADFQNVLGIFMSSNLETSKNQDTKKKNNTSFPSEINIF